MKVKREDSETRRNREIQQRASGTSKEREGRTTTGLVSVNLGIYYVLNLINLISH